MHILDFRIWLKQNKAESYDLTSNLKINGINKFNKDIVIISNNQTALKALI